MVQENKDIYQLVVEAKREGKSIKEVEEQKLKYEKIKRDNDNPMGRIEGV